MTHTKFYFSNPDMGWGGALQGGISGAATGASIAGPWGLLGAVPGAILGYYSEEANEPDPRLAHPEWYKAFGGSVPYTAEGDEVVEGGVPQVVGDQGAVQQIAPGAAKIEGPSHGNGGVDLVGGQYVYSDKMNTGNGNTFAQEAEKLYKEFGKITKLYSDNNDRFLRGTYKRMLQRIENKLGELRTKQEVMRPAAEAGMGQVKKSGGWIQKATASIKRRGTEGKCTPITKPGCTGRAKALALTFKKIAAGRKKELGGKVDENYDNMVKTMRSMGSKLMKFGGSTGEPEITQSSGYKMMMKQGAGLKEENEALRYPFIDPIDLIGIGIGAKMAITGGKRVVPLGSVTSEQMGMRGVSSKATSEILKREKLNSLENARIIRESYGNPNAGKVMSGKPNKASYWDFFLKQGPGHSNKFGGPVLQGGGVTGWDALGYGLQAAGPIFDIMQSTRPTETPQFERISYEPVDYSKETRSAINELDMQRTAAIRAARENATSAQQYLSHVRAIDYDIARKKTEIITGAGERAANVNAQGRNEVSARNAAIQMAEEQARSQASAVKTKSAEEGLYGLGTIAGGIGRDIATKNLQQKQMDIYEKHFNYSSPSVGKTTETNMATMFPGGYKPNTAKFPYGKSPFAAAPVEIGNETWGAGDYYSPYTMNPFYSGSDIDQSVGKTTETNMATMFPGGYKPNTAKFPYGKSPFAAAPVEIGNETWGAGDYYSPYTMNPFYSGSDIDEYGTPTIPYKKSQFYPVP